MTYSFVKARWFTPTPGRTIDLLVVHTMEAAEKPTTAEAVARYFATTSTKASAHLCIDNDSIVQCVRWQDVAYAAPGANHNGIHLEHAGYARQTAAEWDDAYSARMLRRSAEAAAQLCRQFDVPARWVTVAGLKAGERGITAHAHVSEAFKLSTHTDPGRFFPAGRYVGMVQDFLAPPTPPAPAPVVYYWTTEDGEPMATTYLQVPLDNQGRAQHSTGLAYAKFVGAVPEAGVVPNTNGWYPGDPGHERQVPRVWPADDKGTLQLVCTGGTPGFPMGVWLTTRP